MCLIKGYIVSLLYLALSTSLSLHFYLTLVLYSNFQVETQNVQNITQILLTLAVSSSEAWGTSTNIGIAMGSTSAVVFARKAVTWTTKSC